MAKTKYEIDFTQGLIFTVFASFSRLDVLYSLYPVTWDFTALVQNILLVYFFRKLKFEAKEK